MQIKEDNLTFTFLDQFKVIKFDDQNYYRKTFSKYLQGAKGVDFIAHGKRVFLFLEVKDFSKTETENRYRLKHNYCAYDKNRKKMVESLDIEVAKKVKDTLACLFASKLHESKPQMAEYFEWINKKHLTAKFQIKVILFLEGKFQNFSTVADVLQRSLKKKLKWLNARVRVENSKQQKLGGYYTVN